MTTDGRDGPGVRRLSAVDRMYLALESPTTPMHFGALVILDGRSLLGADGSIGLADLRRRIAERTLAVPEVRRVVHQRGPLAGGPCWIDDPDFRIERHVRQVTMPPGPGDDDALLRFAEPLMAPLLERDHPLWRLWFVTGLPDARVALLFVVHHALADGLGSMRLARALLLESAPADERAPARRAARGPDRPVARPVAWRGAVRLVRTFVAGWWATRREPPTSLNAPVGEHRRTAVLRLDAVATRRIAHAHDTGVNELVLDLLAGGVRALLQARHEPLDRLQPRVGIAVTLAARARDGGGNHFGSYVVPLPVDEPDPAARLRALRAALTEAKRTQQVSGVTGVRAWTARIPVLRRVMARQRVIQVMETYLPGPPRPIRLLGAPVLGIVPLAPLGRNVGLTLVAGSYAGCLTLALRTDPDCYPDLDVLLTTMSNDWQALALGARSGPEMI
jgi:WS/DGAT/MGAT family acyltransferase